MILELLTQACQNDGYTDPEEIETCVERRTVLGRNVK